MDLKIGDIVLFIHKESTHTSQHYWRLGRISKIQSNQRPIKVLVAYKNVNEKDFRETERTSRELVVIHKVNDLDFNSNQHQEILFALSHFSLGFQKVDEPYVRFVAVY